MARSKRDDRSPRLVLPLRPDPPARGNTFAAARARRVLAAELQPLARPLAVSAARLSDAARSETASRVSSEPVKARSSKPQRDDDLGLRKRDCLRANRPVSNRGDGSGRSFVPWCQKS